MARPVTVNPKDMQLQIRMPAALHNKLRRRAYLDNRPLAYIARELIEEGLKTARKPVEVEVAP